jgi:carbamoyl-phosphate synthase large subunit
MRKPCRVLVTGAGSGVGQGIIKALRISGLPVTIVVADISSMNVALYRADEALIIPRVEDANALDLIIEMLDQYRIDVVMVGSEFDLEFFSINKKEIKDRSGAEVIVSPPATVAIANDKWLTAEFLRMNNLPYAQAYLPDNLDDAIKCADQWGYPVVLKTRRGTSSRHVYIIKDRESLRKLYLDTPVPMLQRMIDAPSNDLGCEYTCSVFKDARGELIGPFTARRTVRGGTSWHIEVAEFDVLNETLLAIAKALDFSGSLNIQLMLTSEGAVPFELNSRFSGTTAVRAHFGFNEPTMALQSFFYNEKIPLPIIRSGIAMRYHEEVFIEGVTSEILKPSIHQGIVVPWF